MKIKLLALNLIVLLGVFLSFGSLSNPHCATYYIDPNGNDSFPGSRDLPWKTPKKAAIAAAAGDTVIFNDGEYYINKRVHFATAGTAAEPIVFKAANRHKAKIIGPINDKDHVYSILGIFQYKRGCMDVDLYIEIDGLDLQGGYDHVIQICGANHVTIRNCKLHGSGRDCIKNNRGANYTLIENNEIFDSGQRDSCPANPENCNSEGIDVTSSNYVTIRNNYIHNIRSWGLYLKKGSKYGIIEKNLIHDCGEGGIGLGESTVCYDSIAKNNVLYNIAMSCLQASGAKNCGFYNNTCYNVSTLKQKNWAGLRACPAQHTKGAKPEDDKYCKNVEFKNNIVVLNNNAVFCFKATNQAFGSSASTKRAERIKELTMDNNIYYNLTGEVKYSFIFEGHTETGITKWQRWTARKGKRQGKYSRCLDPNFLSTIATNNNFLKICVSSPAIDAGTDLTSKGVTDDYYGNSRPQNNRFDIGAHEYHANPTQN